MDDHRTANLASWDERAPAHARSPDYALARFAADPDFISDVVRFDRERLGDLRGLEGVHLQCHIGTDTVSLARLGARMTGLDFSAPALVEARRLAAAAGAEVTFVEAELYDAPQALGRPALRPRLHRRRRARLAPGHPRLGRGRRRAAAPRRAPAPARGPPGAVVARRPAARRPARDRVPVLRACRAEPLRRARHLRRDRRRRSRKNVTYEWNHGLGEIVSALLDAGLRLTRLEEHDSVPWDAQPGAMEALPAASTGSATARGACPTPTRCRPCGCSACGRQLSPAPATAAAIAS